MYMQDKIPPMVIPFCLMLPVNDCISSVYTCFCSALSVPLDIKFLSMSTTVLVINN